MSKKRNRKHRSVKPRQDEPRVATEEGTKPDWKHPCDVCGQVPTLPITGMCGPCTFGEADTAGGNW